MAMNTNIIFVFLCLALVTLAAGASFDCDMAPADPQDRRTNKEQLVITTFNVEWLFDGVTGPSSCPWKTAEEADRHLELVATFVATMNPLPDVLMMQEVQDCDMLRRLAKALPGGEAVYRAYMVKGTDTSTQQNTGMLTKIDPETHVFRTSDRFPYPIGGEQCGYKGSDGTQGVSKHMFAQLRVGSRRLALANIHFLAFPTESTRCAKREAQANVIRYQVDEFLTKGMDVIILGDHNDYSADVPDSADNKPSSRVVNILRNGVIKGASSPAANATTPSITESMSLEEVSALVKQPSRYTSAYGTDLVSQIDHLLISNSLIGSLSHAYIDHGFPRGVVSDHWPLTAVLKTSDW
ncbi:endonuclease/exonuclease/phosphatase [Thecamonas trahens ATCC 50062]|uniref:Endonuclease/exonuclease/phosphatase n=1 Tax=Thecamonas trahens ATCC 50062 TaxID=461836 RepID=A0A0L0D846_THETB|nr:endonuclease/exonuclease/phosphatase [Thecamonas trahens ATCC 50062]KNC48514.1 endonuclease/exonuclease/phosphatase [Thecamonas trahens ATCC 50062]|eukprot:XP_013758622.1 endonuclease/exonuclease/phosphatase [Thecamonas trahens ATCC 50062]